MNVISSNQHLSVSVPEGFFAEDAAENSSRYGG